MAAKTKYDGLAKDLQSKLEIEQALVMHLNQVIDTQKAEISDAEKYIDQLHEIVKQAEEKRIKLEDSLKVKAAEQLAQELLISKLRERTHTAEETLAHANSNDQIAEQNVKLQQQLKTAVHRINDLKYEIEDMRRAKLLES